MLRVFKANGAYRWISVSSSAFEDRAGETVSTEAVDYSLQAAKGDYGELRLYHLPGSRIGICDGSMRVGMFLVETGIFDKTDAAVSVRSTVSVNPDKYGVSIGFKYRPTDLVEGCYQKIRIFERSIVEEPDAAALFTNIRLSSAEAMVMEEKEKLVTKLTEMLGGDRETAERFYDGAHDIGIKMLAGEELAFKETEEPVAEEVVEEAEPEVEETEEAAEAEPEDAEEEECCDEPCEEPCEEEVEEEGSKDFVLELDLPTIQALAEQIAQRIPAPEQDAVKDVQTKLKFLQKQLDSVGKILNHLLKSDEDKLAEMQKQLPRMRLAYRPSTESETVTETPEITVAEKTQAAKNIIDQSLDESINEIERARRQRQVAG